MAIDFGKWKDSKLLKVLKSNLLIILIVIAVIIGVGLGLGLRNIWSHEELRKVHYLEFPGRILLNMLKMLILPLVVSSLITGMASIGSQATGKIGAAAVAYYMCTTLSAVIIGIVLVIAIHPGTSDDREKLAKHGKSTDTDPLDSLLDLIIQCFPNNLVSACFQRTVTEIQPKNITRCTNKTTNETISVEVDEPIMVVKDGTNVLGIVVFSIALGIVINRLGEQGHPLRDFFAALNSAVMVLIHIVIWYTPFGLIFLVAGKFVTTENLGDVWSGLALYMVTVMSGLLIHAFLVLPLIFFVCTRTNPFKFGLNMLRAILTAWGTASSSATLPVTMDCLIQKNNIDINIVRFVVPVGATINMDGTALYEAVASIFIAQLNGVSLSAAKVIIISLTATAAAIGAAGVPQAGLVTMVIVLTAVGLPADDVTFILAVDWFLDRFRTAVNVWGDSVGAGVLNHYFKDIVKTSTDDLGDTINEDTTKYEHGNDSLSDRESGIGSTKKDKPPSYYSQRNVGHESEDTEMNKL